MCAASLSGKGIQSYSVKLPRPNDIFCSSNDVRIRILSALIILQTIGHGITLYSFKSSDLVLFFFAVNAINEALQILKCDLRQTDVSECK